MSSDDQCLFNAAVMRDLQAQNDREMFSLASELIKKQLAQTWRQRAENLSLEGKEGRKRCIL